MSTALLIDPNVSSETTISRKNRRSWSLLGLRITFSGILTVAVTILVGLSALNSEANLLLLLFGISAGMIALSLVIPARMIRHIVVSRSAPEAVVAGRPFKLVYVVYNRRNWLRAWSIIVSESPTDTPSSWLPSGHIPVLEPRQNQQLELIGNCHRRGRLRLVGIRVTCRFPLGLFSCSIDIPSNIEIPVYPAVGRMRLNPWHDHRYCQASASKATRDRQDEQEFFGLREYRDGDDYRWIHWRRSARTGQLVVREMMSPRQTRLVVMLDPWSEEVSNGRSPRSIHETATIAEGLISCAATAICDGLDRGYQVGLICRCSIPLMMAPAAGSAHRQRLLKALAEVAAGEAPELDLLVSRARWAVGLHTRCLILARELSVVHSRVARFLGRRSEAAIALSPATEGFATLFDLTGPRRTDRRRR